MKQINVTFTDIKPTKEGIYFYRQSKRQTTSKTWEIVEVFKRSGIFWVKDKKFNGCSMGVSLYNGQFSLEYFNVQ